MLDEKYLRKLSKNLISEPDNYMYSLRENIRMYIDEKDITLAEIAEAADIPESTLKSLVYGNATDCKLSNIIKLAKVLHISVDELVGCGTISPQTTESLQLVRQLPKSFTHFVRWCIHYHTAMLTKGKISTRSVEIMQASISDTGSMKMTNELEILDISQIDETIRPKIFIGIKIPSNLYAPSYYAEDIILIANDRNPRPGEHVVAAVNNQIYILKPDPSTLPQLKSTKPETGILNTDSENIDYYFICDGQINAKLNENYFVMGYVVKTVREHDEGIYIC